MGFTQTAAVAADADAVFRTLTDISRLPIWNAAMTSVVDQPDRLDVGRIRGRPLARREVPTSLAALASAVAAPAAVPPRSGNG